MISSDIVHPKSQLIKHVVENKLISSLLMVDIGARGGINPLWSVFNPLIKATGFDVEGGADTEGVFNIAFSDESGKRKFYLLKYGASSSFYPPDTKFTNRLRDAGMFEVIKEIEVKTKTLDSFNVEPDFLKIDAEGAELDILKGSIKTLSCLVGLEVEVEFFQERIGQPVFSDVDSFLRRQGFNLYNMRLLRYPRRPFNAGTYHIGNVTKGQIISAHCLYFRDFIPVIKDVSKDKILKQACIMDLHDLPDCAIELLAYAKMNDLIPLVDASKCYEFKDN
ncbi:MAG: FkbM family methyltransferase [Candidatus Omnitrophica bacterium]|nr:FkbM family methyltransferase [Candidatus Omnitrophota bacterium]